MEQQPLGKTTLAIELAKRANGEILSSDSMQIYKDMNIGTAKPTEEEMENIKHHMIDFVDPDRRYSVSEFKAGAEVIIKDILSRGKLPIIAGGTGLYINSLIYGIEYSDVTIDEEYRKKLNELAERNGLEELYEEALQIDPEAMKIISPNDRKRIIRVLEIYKQTGKTKTELEIESRKNGVPYNYKVFAIDMDREILYDRINKRVDIMIEQGLIEEVKDLLEKYKEFPTALQGLGYKETKRYLDGEITREELIEEIKQETRKYAKRQLTWFRKNKEITWLDSSYGIEKNIDIILEEV